MLLRTFKSVLRKPVMSSSSSSSSSLSLPLPLPTSISSPAFFSSSSGPVQRRLEEKLQTLQPVHLQVVNESYMHNVPKGSESHFKVIIVSPHFENKTLLERHRTVNDTLKEELRQSIHALSITAKTPSQWAQSNLVTPSPPCLGGSKN